MTSATQKNGTAGDIGPSGVEAIISQRCSKCGPHLGLPSGDPCRGVEASPSGMSANSQVVALGMPWEGRLLQKVDSRRAL